MFSYLVSLCFHLHHAEVLFLCRDRGVTRDTSTGAEHSAYLSLLLGHAPTPS